MEFEQENNKIWLTLLRDHSGCCIVNTLKTLKDITRIIFAIIQARNDGDLEEADKGRGSETLYSGCIEMMHGEIFRAINNPHILEIVK